MGSPNKPEVVAIRSKPDEKRTDITRTTFTYPLYDVLMRLVACLSNTWATLNPKVTGLKPFCTVQGYIVGDNNYGIVFQINQLFIHSVKQLTLNMACFNF